MPAKISNNVYVRRVYDKLRVSVSLGTLLQGVGLSQTFDGTHYSPDHSVTPLVLSPVVSAKAPDIDANADWSVGVDTSSVGNGNTAWRINGQPISSVWVQNQDYRLENDDKELWILKNIEKNTKCDITCKIVVTDFRTGVSSFYETDVAPLSTVSSTNAAVTLRVGLNNVEYDFLADDLYEWEYRNARSLPQLMSQAAATNDSCYLKTVDLFVGQGSNGRQTAGYGIVVKTQGGTTVATLHPNGTLTIADRARIVALSLTEITFDCRTISKEKFNIQVTELSNGSVVNIVTAKDSITVLRKLRDFDTPVIENNAEYGVRNERYHNSVRVSCNGTEVEYPECFFNIDYFTVANKNNAPEVYVGSGNDCWFNPNVAGDGLTHDTNGFFQNASVDYHDVLELANDENNEDVLDENGELLLI